MRRLLITALASLTALGGVAFATHGHVTVDAPPLASVFVTPQRQSIVRGATASFSIDVGRAAGSNAATALAVARLPPGVDARWRLPDGTRSAVVPRAKTHAILMLRTSAGTPLGILRVKVTATGGGATRTREVMLIVKRRGALHFSLKASPRRQVVAQGATARYTIRVVREAGFRRRVTLRVLSLPRGARVRRTAASLSVATAAGQRTGSDRVVVEGTSRIGGRTVRRHADVVLTVVEARPFPIGGDLGTSLFPGALAPLDLVLTNPYPFALQVVALRVRVGAATSDDGCDGDANYAVMQYSGPYPLVLAPGRTRLSTLVSRPSTWPQIAMHDLASNQDPCRGAVLSLGYRGLASR